MDREQLRAVQEPLKERYRNDPEAALVTLRASGTLGDGITCSVATGRALAEAGLHPASGGDGLTLCSGDMLLEALAACAGVTMRAVAASLGLGLETGVVRAEGDLDFRGTLAVEQGRAGRLPRDSPPLRARERRERRGPRHAGPPDGALLRRPPDDRPATCVDDQLGASDGLARGGAVAHRCRGLLRATLHEGAVGDEEADQDDRQCRNWPDHASRIGRTMRPSHHWNEAIPSCSRSTCSVRSARSRARPPGRSG